MLYTIKLLPIVRQGLKKAKKWYANKNVTLAKEFLIEVNKEIGYIASNPKHYQLKYKSLRVSLVTRFPYAIFYLVEEGQKQIVLIGVLHTSRNPEIIKKRITKI